MRTARQEEKEKIKTLIIGKSNSKGFTLIELMLVIMVVGVMLFLAVPATRDALTTDKIKKASRQIIGLERKLRTDAVRDQIDYILNFDLPGSVFWITTSDMTAEKLAEIKINARHLPEGVVITDISGENDQKQTGGEIRIRFSKNNICPPTVMHFAYEETKMTLVINPFWGVAGIYDKYVDVSSEGSGNAEARW